MTTPELQTLHEIRANTGSTATVGLADEVVERMLQASPTLRDAIHAAASAFTELREQQPELLTLSEQELQLTLQQDFQNFYSPDSTCAYTPIAAKGPWLITLHGAVLYETGGYGMLGFGHSPDSILAALAKPYVMANIKTPSIQQKRFTSMLRKKIGFRRNACPFGKFMCLNSGSESMTVAFRLASAHAKTMTDPEGPHAGKAIKALALRGAFHGRTYRPSRISDSTRATYHKFLASFRDHNEVVTVEPNNIEQLRSEFDRAQHAEIYFEAMFMEPVMGEGNPGVAITPEFYAEARKLTQAHQSLLIVDSIQAALRTHGCLSIVDYPGFESLDAPDMETYSKAVNAGQFPLSVLALSDYVANVYQPSLYGNTMTANPRALEVGCATLALVTDELSENIQQRGKEFITKLMELQSRTDDAITAVNGTGLLVAAELNSDVYNVVGERSVERYMHQHGVNVIHGGRNALRFTPSFTITSNEIDLITGVTEQALRACK